VSTMSLSSESVVWGRNMKGLVLAAAALLACLSAIPARAAEVYGGAIPPDVFTAPPAFAPPRVYNWTGVYIGINAGGAWGPSPWVVSAPWISIPPEGKYTLSGGLLGGTLGYNLQAGTSSFVVGGEADFAFTNIKGTISPFVSQVIGFDPVTGNQIVTPTPGCSPNCEVATPWLATARLRFGYSFDWILPYVTAGVAIARIEADTAGLPFGRQSSNNLGWTVGGGVEIVIDGPWTVKLEFLHADFNGFSCTVQQVNRPLGITLPGACGPNTVSINATENIIRAGLNLKIWNK
jgi:outer membrane immunogenic protein